MNTVSKMYEKAIADKLRSQGLILAGDTCDKPGWCVRVVVDVGEGPAGFTVWATDVTQ